MDRQTDTYRNTETAEPTCSSCPMREEREVRRSSLAEGGLCLEPSSADLMSRRR